VGCSSGLSCAGGLFCEWINGTDVVMYDDALPAAA